MKLTKTQKIAVERMGKSILVSAGAGTGKTRVLVERFLNFVTNGHALVTEILTLTFTEKAAAEMKTRILDSLKTLKLESARRDLELAYISTIHSFATRILREHPIEAAVDPDFTVLEEEEAELLRELALDEVIETGCMQADGTFELLKIYGEQKVRAGLSRIFATARTEGNSLSEFFGETPSPFPSPSGRGEGEGKKEAQVSDLLAQLGEAGLAEEWKRFCGIREWNWETVQDFKLWSQPFSKRGGKKEKPVWREIVRGTRELLGLRIDGLAAPWREKAQKLALAFEAQYELRKKEQCVLDFDDLQIKSLQLFEKQNPANRKLLEHYRKHFKFILVDEFQDINPLQSRLIQILSSSDNLFFVGDYKQSIYGFRGASPEHFLEMEERCKKEEVVKIPLVENFRTSAPVLEFINSFFKTLWDEDGFSFDELMACVEESGVASATSVELLVTERKKGESLDHARMREAAQIAERIHSLQEEGFSFGGMAILFQAMTSSGIYEQALKKAGIPYFVVSGRGFYHQPEVRDMISFLSCLENPLSDIALAATLRSPFFHVTDDTLFWLAERIKKESEWKPLYDGLCDFESVAEIPESEKEKLRFFQTLMGEFLSEKDRLRLAELLDRILARTSYLYYVLADPQGIRKYANLRKLVELAREYESREILALGDFIRMLKGLESREIRESEAQVESEKSGKVVRLMTIHAAKGLEFPVVFLADLAHQTHAPEPKTFISGPKLGFSLQVRNEKTLEMEKPFSWTRINDEIDKRECDEWKRLFYVAATRTISRLFLSGVHQEKKEPKKTFREMSSWMDWVMFSREKNDAPPVYEGKGSNAGRSKLPPWRKKSFQPLIETFKSLPAEPLFQSQAELKRMEQSAAQIIQRFQPCEKTLSRSVDLPVSAFAAFKKDPEYYWRIYEVGYPDFAAETEYVLSERTDEDVNAADFGTAMHRLLEHTDFRDPSGISEKDFAKFFRGMGDDKIREARDIFSNFIKSPLFRRVQKSKSLLRELPFALNERHGRVEGVIDLLFVDDQGKWHILDYKTAVGDPEKVVQAGYDLQIKLYAYAVQEILKTTPASAIVYFLKNQYEHSIPLTARDLAQFQGGFRELQERVVKMRNARIAAAP